MDEADDAAPGIAERVNDGVTQARIIMSGPGTSDGLCVDCGEIIPPQRLKEVPWTERCVGCQEIYEGYNESNVFMVRGKNKGKRTA